MSQTICPQKACCRSPRRGPPGPESSLWGHECMWELFRALTGRGCALRIQLWPGPWLSKSWTVTWALLENCVHWEMINKTGQVTEALLERMLLQGLDPGDSLPSASLSPSCSYRTRLDTWWLSSPYRPQAADHQITKQANSRCCSGRGYESRPWR